MKTVTHFFARRLALTLLAIFTTTMMWAQVPLSGGGTADDPYQIQNAQDWNGLADYVAAGNTCQGLYFLMTANIGTTADPITKAIGKQATGSDNAGRNRFDGVFDGGNHTLTINFNTTTDEWWTNNHNYCAPFAYLNNIASNATIKNLHVAGTITTDGQFAGGLIGSSGKSAGNVGKCTVEHCRVSVEIINNYATGNDRYANHGGFIGIAEGSATIQDSWFDGSFSGHDYKYSGGFIGLNKAASTLTNCLFNPSSIASGLDVTGACEFIHNNKDYTNTLTNCYWVTHFGEPENAQGQRVYATEPDDTVYTYISVTAADENTYFIITGNLGWQTIQEALNIDGTTYVLSASIEAGLSDAALEVPTGASVTLNMGNYTLDRGLALEAAQADGYVIKVNSGATLTINGGTITGGHNTGNGGGIYNEGTLIINGTTITSNKASGNGGGIYNAGQLTINGNGATITNNVGENENSRGIGVYVANGTFNIQGNVQIHDNHYTYYKPTQVRVAHNLYLDGTTQITVIGALTGASIHVDGQANIISRVITNGLNGTGTLNDHFSIDDNKNFGLYETSDGEVKLNAAMTIDVTGYGSSERSDKWVFIASPVDGNIAPTAVTNLKSGTAANYDLFSFDQTQEAEWHNYKAHTNGFVLENGKGYLYANKSNVTLKFLGDYNEGTIKTVNLDYEDGKKLAGWNLVGNPFTVPAYVNRPYYKINDNGDGITAVSEYWQSGNEIAPCTGIMVVAENGNESVTFSTTAPEAPEAGSKGNLSIALSNANTRSNTTLDNAIVSFNEGCKLGKFYFGEQNAHIYIPQENKEYAIATSDKQGEMTVNFKANVNGQYTINVNPENVEMDYLHLIDNLTGADVDLLAEPSYTFSGKTTDYASRFRLVFSAQNNSNEENIQDDFAFVNNGQIILTNVEGDATLQVIDMTGRIVLTSKDGMHAVFTNGITPGIYVLRLIQGESVRTQKVRIMNLR